METTMMKRYIDATQETKATLAKVFKVTEKFVYMCLTYRKNNDTARKIRFTAVHNYGAKPMAHYPICETLHDTTEDGRQVMRQEFDNGCTLLVDKRTGEAWLTGRKGDALGHWLDINFPKLYEIQVLAENM
jgi:hypothetical protein